MAEFFVEIGEQVNFAKTVGETDVYMFADITGDFSDNHVNEEAMEKTRYGGRIAHGALMVGYMSTASTMMTQKAFNRGVISNPVSLGYDGIRFLGAVMIGDTIHVSYTIAEINAESMRSLADIEVTNQRGELVAVGKHHMKWLTDLGS